MRRRIAIGAAGARGGLGLLSSRASGLFLTKEAKQAHLDAALEREAVRFVRELGELKGAYVKIGQMLALYGEHLLPKPVTNALHTLESQTTALDWAALEPSIKSSLKERWSLFKVEPQSFAAASLAQVHRAEINDIELPVCIKIQYPGIAGAIEDDFRNVMQMLTLARWIEPGRQLEQLTKELKKSLLQEVDYRYELETAQLMSAYLALDWRYRIPKYVPNYSNESLLTMEYIQAYDLNHEKVQSLSQERRNALAVAMLELFFKETFEWGLMQTDPNFGNYRILIDETAERDQLVLLDFGAVHHLNDSFTSVLKEIILSAHVGDIDGTIRAAIALGCLRESDLPNVKRSFAEFCCFILEPFLADLSEVPDFAKTSGGLYDWHASRLLNRAGKLGSKGMLVKGFVVPPSEFMLMVRKLTGVFTFVATLKAKLNSASILQQYAD